MISVTIPLRTVSEANRRDHWATKAKRVASQRGIVGLALRGPMMAWCGSSAARAIPCVFGSVAKLTRISPRKLDDDNLRGALKAVRDAVAFTLGVDDANPSVEWEYAQEKGKPAVRIEIRRR